MNGTHAHAGDSRPLISPAGCAFQRTVRRERMRLTVLIPMAGSGIRRSAGKTIPVSGNNRSVFVAVRIKARFMQLREDASHAIRFWAFHTPPRSVLAIPRSTSNSLRSLFRRTVIHQTGRSVLLKFAEHADAQQLFDSSWMCRCPPSAYAMIVQTVLSQSWVFRAKLKNWDHKFNGLQDSKFIKNKLCDRTADGIRYIPTHTPKDNLPLKLAALEIHDCCFAI